MFNFDTFIFFIGHWKLTRLPRLTTRLPDDVDHMMTKDDRLAIRESHRNAKTVGPTQGVDRNVQGDDAPLDFVDSVVTNQHHPEDCRRLLYLRCWKGAGIVAVATGSIIVISCSFFPLSVKESIGGRFAFHFLAIFL
jgi:hypothetical protein